MLANCMIAKLLRLCLLIAGLAGAEEIRLPDTDSKLHAPLSADDRPAVLLFVSPFCPTTRSFMPEILDIAGSHAEQARFYLVHSDPTVTPEIALQHADLFQVKQPVLLDREQKLALQVGARITPEVVVMVGGEVRYRGRINDLYLGPTKRQRSATTRDLRDALEALQAGRPVPEPQHEAQGCKIGGLPKP
jgi:thiol-disulfide isomerase/thioredoxin